MSSTYSVYDIKIDNSLAFTPGATAGYVLAINTNGSTYWSQPGSPDAGATGPTGATGSAGANGATGSFTYSVFESYLSAGATATALTTESNWAQGASYSGTALTGTYQGQKYFNGGFMYEAVDDNQWVRYELDRKTAFQTLVDAATIAWTYSYGYNAKVTLGGNRALSIIGATTGDYGTLIVTQGPAGGYRINFGASDKFASATYSFSTTGTQSDIFTWVYDGTNYYWNFNKTFS